MWLLITVGSSLFFYSCKDDEKLICCNITPNSYGFEQAFLDIDSADIRVLLASNSENLHTGYQKLNLVFLTKSTGDEIDMQEVNIKPMMDMGMMKHSAPFEQNSTTTSDGQVSFDVVFIMPGTDMAKWTIPVSFKNSSGKEFQVELPIKVTEPTTSSLYQFLDSAQKVHFVSLLNGGNFKLGENPIEFTVHSRMDMMNFPSVEDLEIQIEPWMPTMGHGSPNNVDPVHVKDGHYKGKVNFTMTGLWHIKVRIKKNGDLVAPEFYFEINL